MADVTAALVRELRERTGAGMMDCKRTLVETDGDVEAAIEAMRKSGAAKADKKADRTAAEGLVSIQVDLDTLRVAMLEINCETDFVARDENFTTFANQLADQTLAAAPADVSALMALPYQGQTEQTVDAERKTLISKLGENINVRRLVMLRGQAGTTLGHYLHGGRIGVVLLLQGGDEALAKGIAMHIAASKPEVVKPEQVSQELIDKEKAIFTAQAEQSGKPAEIIEKMIQGRIKKYLDEISLLGQPYVKDPNQTVGQVLKQAGAEVTNFVRYEVGEGIEKKEDNFVEEVMAQARGDA